MDIEVIYDKYFRIIYRYLLSLSQDPHLSEELAQETFLKALSGIDSIEEGRNAKAWLCRVARNLYFQHYNKSRRRRQILEENAEEVFMQDPETELMQKLGNLHLHRLLHQLPEPYREVFMLRQFGELTFRQIGEIFERNESWTRTIYYRARKKLMEGLQDEDHM